MFTMFRQQRGIVTAADRLHPRAPKLITQMHDLNLMHTGVDKNVALMGW